MWTVALLKDIGDNMPETAQPLLEFPGGYGTRFEAQWSVINWMHYRVFDLAVMKLGIEAVQAVYLYQSDYSNPNIFLISTPKWRKSAYRTTMIESANLLYDMELTDDTCDSIEREARYKRVERIMAEFDKKMSAFAQIEKSLIGVRQHLVQADLLHEYDRIVAGFDYRLRNVEWVHETVDYPRVKPLMIPTEVKAFLQDNRESVDVS